MSDFGEYKYVKTRKEHLCIYCGRMIPKGLTVRNYHGMWENDWQNWYACDFCIKFVEPDYVDVEEGISGDGIEFNDWFYESGYINCSNCNTLKCVHDWDWENLTHIKIRCSGCEHTWVVEIPIELERQEEE